MLVMKLRRQRISQNFKLTLLLNIELRLMTLKKKSGNREINFLRLPEIFPGAPFSIPISGESLSSRGFPRVGVHGIYPGKVNCLILFPKTYRTYPSFFLRRRKITNLRRRKRSRKEKKIRPKLHSFPMIIQVLYRRRKRGGHRRDRRPSSSSRESFPFM